MGNCFIAKLRAFDILTPEDEAALTVATSSPMAVAAKHHLIREGDKPGPVFVVLEGWACRYKVLPSGSRQVLAFLMPGDSCDLHIGLLAEMDHSIQTVTPALVAKIGRAEMDEMMDRHRGIARAMYISQLVDEGTMRAWITSMGRRVSIERLAHLMCELYVRAHNIGLTTDPYFTLPVPQILLADALGMTPVHLNRVLQDLRRAGAVLLQRGSVLVTDPDQLRQIAGFDGSYLHRRLRKAI